MKKSSAIAAGVIVVGVAGWLGATWYTGTKIEAHSQRYLTTANEKLENLSPLFGLRLEQLSYERGWFSSKARYALSFVERSASEDKLPTEKLEFESHIEHGPFPKGALSRGVFAPRLAFAHTELARTDDLNIVFALFKGVSPISSDDIVSYRGKVQSVAQIAPLQFSDDETKLDFSGMRMKGEYEFARKSFVIDAVVDKLAINSQKDQPVDMNLTGMSLTGASRMGKFDLGIGDSTLNVKRMEITLPDGDGKVTIDDLGYTAKVRENDTAISVEAAYRTGNVMLNDILLGSGQTVLKLDNLDGAALKQIADAYNSLMAQVMSNGDADVDDDLLPAVEANVRKLLAGKPSLSIAPVSWKTDKGESLFTATVDLDLPQESLDELSLKQAAIQAIKRIDAKLVLSKPMLQGLMTQYSILNDKMMPDEAASEAEDQVRSLAGLAEMMNVGKNDGDNIVGTFVFADGVGNLNGTEIPQEELFGMLDSSLEEEETEEYVPDVEAEADVAAAAAQAAADAAAIEADEATQAATTAEQASNMLEEFDIDHVVKLLEEQGEKVTVEEEDDAPVLRLDPSSVGASALRVRFLCNSFSGACQDLVYVAEYKSDKPLSLERINSWNQEYRWTRAYLDDDGVAFVEMDLNAEGGIGAESLRILHNTFISIAEDFAKYASATP